eukprot:GHVQ01040158.1.p1 GENE.GHVQ01040158.1~~GHVQ01040158.1.p1  ORF type:complete len:813 (+),score=150.37 GHVQ01040158.1:132-2570(+)
MINIFHLTCIIRIITDIMVSSHLFLSSFLMLLPSLYIPVSSHHIHNNIFSPSASRYLLLQGYCGACSFCRKPKTHSSNHHIPQFAIPRQAVRDRELRRTDSPPTTVAASSRGEAVRGSEGVESVSFVLFEPSEVFEENHDRGRRDGGLGELGGDGMMCRWLAPNEKLSIRFQPYWQQNETKSFTGLSLDNEGVDVVDPASSYPILQITSKLSSKRQLGEQDTCPHLSDDTCPHLSDDTCPHLSDTDIPSTRECPPRASANNKSNEMQFSEEEQTDETGEEAVRYYRYLISPGLRDDKLTLYTAPWRLNHTHSRSWRRHEVEEEARRDAGRGEIGLSRWAREEYNDWILTDGRYKSSFEGEQWWYPMLWENIVKEYQTPYISQNANHTTKWSATGCTEKLTSRTSQTSKVHTDSTEGTDSSGTRDSRCGDYVMKEKMEPFYEAWAWLSNITQIEGNNTKNVSETLRGLEDPAVRYSYGFDSVGLSLRVLLERYVPIVRQGQMQQGHMQQGHMQQGHMQQGHMQQGHMQQGHMQQGHMEQGHMQQGHMQQDSTSQQRHKERGQEKHRQYEQQNTQQEHTEDGQGPNAQQHKGKERDETVDEQEENRHREEAGRVRAVVIGSQYPWVEYELLRGGIHHVTTIEYLNLSMVIPPLHPHLTAIRPTTDNQQILNQLQTDTRSASDTSKEILEHVEREEEGEECGIYDIGVSYSSFEHVGLGRYGDSIDSDGDLKAIADAACLVKPGGLMLVGVPTWGDCMLFNMHRYYGKKRLQMLLECWNVIDGSEMIELYDCDINNPLQFKQPWIVLQNIRGCLL